MANWLLDYIEMTEYIPSELREQLTSIRELDLQVHNAMHELERDIKQFFSKINILSLKERQEQYDAFLKKCDVATRAASDKVKVADKLHDLVEKSMRLLDQGLEKLKEDLLEGDKAYVVEDLERKSRELDEQLKLEQETMLLRQSKLQELKTNSSSISSKKTNIESNPNHHIISQINHHRHSLPAQHQQSNHIKIHHRSRNSASFTNSVGRQKKRERKHLNSTMTIFNRNSRLEDDSTNQTFLTSPLTPDYPAAIHDTINRAASLNDLVGGNNNSSSSSSGSLTMKGMMTGNRTSFGIFDKINGNDSLIQAKQPILTASDAAHAVSPNATNSDKLVSFSSNPNGDTHSLIVTHNSDKKQNHSQILNAAQQPHPYQLNQLNNQLLSTVGFTSGDSAAISSSPLAPKDVRHTHDQNHIQMKNQQQPSPFSAVPLSSRHDPIMMAASQAINATQNMTPGRRTSSLKASYAAVNSGKLQPAASANQQQVLEQAALTHEVYCKCRSHIQGSNMIACDNTKCKIEWFHYECVGITTPPEGEWFCDDCKITQKSRKQPKLESINIT